MICYLAMSDYDDGVGGLIFFAVLAPIAGLVMYLNSLCLRPGFDQIHAKNHECSFFKRNDSQAFFVFFGSFFAREYGATN